MTNDLTDFPEADAAAVAHHYFRITVKGDGAPLRGVHLRTVNKSELVSDDNGVVAFYEPGLMDREVYFFVTHPGYEITADAFGYRGKAFKVSEGGSAELSLTKTSGNQAPAQGDLPSRLARAEAPSAKTCFALRVFDQETKRGVPLVRVTAFGEALWSDSQGLVAYCNPDHLPTNAASFEVWSHGYALPAGAASVTLDASAGERAEIGVERLLPAERLYRMTGGGAYRDTSVLGLKAPIAQPNLNASVLGQDTASVTVYRGKVFWLWQDTDRASYPLGNFKSTAATSPLPDLARDAGVELSYLENAEGFTAQMCPDCGPGPAWLDGLFSVASATGEEQLFGSYTVVTTDGSPTEAGVMRFNDEQQHFERVITDFTERPGFERPGPHPFELRHGSARYAYYANRLRIPATAEAFSDTNEYERFTPYTADTGAPVLAAGKPDYAFRAGGGRATSQRLKADGFGDEQSLDGHLVNADDGKPLDLVGVATTYHPYRGRFLMAGQQRFGASSSLGEIWQAEADTPMGPWLYAAHIITHDTYTFYNVLYHPEMARGAFAYLEGTYTATYSGATELTPRYDYNQLLYRIDLSRADLVLPVPVYDLDREQHDTLVTKRELRAGAPKLSAAFLAYDAEAHGAEAIAATGASCSPTRRLELTSTPKTPPLFYAMPPTAPDAPGLISLYEYSHADGRHAYALEGATLADGFVRAEKPLARVFRNPVAIELPVADYLPALVADAGPDQCVAAGASVSLDASATTAPTDVKRYLWRIPGATASCDYLEGKSVSVTLPSGLHSIDLEVTDATGNVSHDTAIVDVE